MEIWIVVAALVGALVGWLAAASRYGGRLAGRATECELLRAQVVDARLRLDEVRGEDAERAETLAALTPLREAMGRVERQVAVLERDRMEQYGEIGERLIEVSAQTGALRAQTAGLAGALNSSTMRGVWGESQLRRVCEHAGMLAQCDFEEQVSSVSAHDARVRPDLVVRLPGDRVLVVDAKVPLASFLAAQAEGLTEERRRELLGEHARALRGHVDTLAAKSYWTAFTASPELVVCFVPADAMLAAALSADPGLYDAAQTRKVVLASPATLLALLRAVAFTWRQDALATSARELLALGDELYARLTTVGTHLTRMGGSLKKSVETYNALVGTLESRVLVTARRMHSLGLADAQIPAVPPVELSPRVLTAGELIDAVDAAYACGLTDDDLALPALESAARGEIREAG